MLLSATWGLGSAIAQGEVVPDRIVLSRQGFLRKIEPGRKDHRETCGHGAGRACSKRCRASWSREPCLDAGAGGHARTHAAQGGRPSSACPVEIEWALDDTGFKLLQARPLHVEPIAVPDEIWLQHPGLNGHPAGIGWGSGRAVVVNCECELARVAPGDVLVTRVAGPGAQPCAAARRRRGRRARRLDLASRLARARARHPDGARRAGRHQPHSRRLAGRGRRRRRHRAMDRADAARPSRPRIFVTQPVAESALARLRNVADVKVNPDSQPDHRQEGADRRREEVRHFVFAAARHASIATCCRPIRSCALVCAQSITPDEHRRRRCNGAQDPGHRGAADRRRGDRRHQFRADARGRAADDGRRPPGARAENFPARQSSHLARRLRSGARRSAWSAAAAASARRWRGARTASACASSTGGRAASPRRRARGRH